MLRSLLEVRDAAGAWGYVSRQLIAGKKEDIQDELRDIVCKDYWWLSGELFDLEGDLGWGPGFHEWDDEESLYPAPTKSVVQKLRFFVERLAELPMSSSIRNLKSLYQSDEEFKSLEARMIKFLFQKFPGKPEEAVAFAYNRIATARSEYELGAARPFLNMSLNYDDHLTGLAGLVMILSRGVSRLAVKAEMVKLIRFGRGQKLYLSADVPDYAESSDCKYKATG